MKILLVSPRGFCAGVNRAISALHEALKRWGTPFYVFHEIVHNTWVVEEFRRLGVVFVDSVEDVPAGAHLMFSAHGVSPRIRKRCEEKGIQVVDATCPLVTRIHKQAVQLAEAGFQILLIGHAGHDEIVGIVEEAPEATIVLGSAEEAERVSLLDGKPAAYLTQTTLAGDKAQKIIDVLTRRFPDILPPKTNCICFATQNRQKAVSETAGEADLVLIVGSRNSSNSQRLRELAERKNVPAYLVDGPDDLQKEWFLQEQTVLVSAGASAPESVVEDVVSWIRTHFNADVELREICRETLQFQLPEI